MFTYIDPTVRERLVAAGKTSAPAVQASDAKAAKKQDRKTEIPQEVLEALVEELRSEGGEAFAYSCDLTDYESVDETVKAIQADHGTVHILINNAGRSIRRGIMESLDRFHDF